MARAHYRRGNTDCGQCRKQWEPTMNRLALTINVAVIGLVLNTSGIAVLAADWPVRPVTMVVPYAAGGTVDVVARVLAPHLSEILRQQVVVENVGGAGGVIGTQRVAKASADGYQFVFGTVGTHALNQPLFKHPRYDAANDFPPVGLIVDQSLMLVARKDLPVGNLQEFVAYTKANQARMQFGSAGAGSAVHLACALLNAAIGVNVTHVAYRGGGPAMQDVIAGRIDYMCPNLAVAIPQLEGKQAKAIAILTRDRSSILPHLASAREQGLKDFAAENWFAAFLPRNSPPVVVRTLNEAIAAAVNRPAVQERLRELGAEVVAPERRSPEYLQQFVESEIKRWAEIIKASGLAMN